MMKKITSLIFIFLITISCSKRDEIASSEEQNIPYLTSQDLQIVSPQYADDWQPGTIQVIKWTLPEIVKKVQISLYRKNELKLVLCHVFENSGSFTWEIPQNLPRSVHYRIKIAAIEWPLISQTTRDFFIRDTGDSTMD